MKLGMMLLLSCCMVQGMQTPTFLHKTVSWEYSHEQLKTYLTCFHGSINTYCNGCTPLHEWASWSLGVTPDINNLYSAQEKLALLIEYGADKSLKNKHGQTAMDILQMNYNAYSKHTAWEKGSYAITVLMAQLQFARMITINKKAPN